MTSTAESLQATFESVDKCLIECLVTEENSSLFRKVRKFILLQNCRDPENPEYP